MSGDILFSNELCHQGIKGMKWGVRRFQKTDGTLTDAGKRRYSDDGPVPKKSKHRRNLEANYQAKGMSTKEAEAAANKRIKIEKTIAITAGLTVAACGAYYARNKWIADRTDQILKSGTSFHNLDSKRNPRPGEHLYVNYRQNDRNFFNGRFAVNKMRKTGHVFEHRIEAIDDVKIPSLKTRQSVFKQLCEQDPEFKAAISRHSGMSESASPKKLYKNMWQLFRDKDSEYFNNAKNKYFKALKEKGYAAIVDEWDTNRLVYRSDAPLILLDTNHKSLGKMTIKELKTNDILTAQANSDTYKFNNRLLNAIGAPHTNHFKESTKYLEKYAKLDAKNRSNVETAMFKAKYENGLFNRNEKFDLHQSFKENGKAVAYAGEYLSKNKNMSIREAMSKATAKKERMDTIKAYTTIATSTVPAYTGMVYASNRYQIDKYRKTHPNSKMTDREILRSLQT
jgi:hypothetical protein